MNQFSNSSHPTTSWAGQIVGGSFIKGIYERSWYDEWQPGGGIREWNHICLALDARNNKTKLYEGGHLRFSDMYDWDSYVSFLDNKPLSLNGMLLGTHQTKQDRQVMAQYTSVNIFGRFLEDDEMKAITGCQTDMEGDYLAWSKTEWNVSGPLVDIDLIPFEEVCAPRKAKYILFPAKVSWPIAHETCGKFGGQLWAPVSDAEHREFYNHHLTIPILSEGVCTGYQAIWWGHRGKFRETGHYIVNHYSNQTVYPEGWVNGTYPFAPGWKKRFLEVKMNQTEGKDYTLEENDACFEMDMVMPYHSSAYGLTCSRTWRAYCASCVFENSTSFYVFGLCKETLLESDMFAIYQDSFGNVTYWGESDSGIVWNRKDKIWNWTMIGKPEVYATTNASLHTFMMGTHTWKLFGDTCAPDGGEKKLTFSKCFVGNTYEDLRENGRQGEFTCGDGNCITMDKRCNILADCNDGSDEKDCRTLMLEDGYAKDSIPFKVDTKGAVEKVEVNVSVDVTDVLEISEVQSKFSTKYVLILQWKDPRLNFENLKENSNLNSLTSEEKTKIWVPTVTLKNTRSNERSKNDERSVIRIIRNGKLERKGIWQLTNNRYLYKGKENPVVIERPYDTDFICDYYMAWYPFDNQRCSMVIILPGSEGDYIRLNPVNLEYIGPTDLSQYFIKNTSISRFSMKHKNSTLEGVKVDIVLGRQLLSTVLTVYVPTVLMNILGHITNFFKPFFFESIITVNLTVMLVLTTMFISVSNNLPVTAYLKMIDIWLIFNLILPFIEVLLHTYIDTLRDDTDREVNHHGTVIDVNAAVNDTTQSSSKTKSLSNNHVSPENLNTEGNQKQTPVEITFPHINEETLKKLEFSQADLYSVNEKKQNEALRNYYDDIKDSTSSEKAAQLKRMKRIANYIIPFLAICFIMIYWTIGLYVQSYL